MNVKKITPPIVLLLIVGTTIIHFRHTIRRWWLLRSYKQDLQQIYQPKLSTDTIVHCFDNEFRASIPIYKKGENFYTIYDFEKNRLEGSDTVYVSVNGDDSYSGRNREKAKHTIESALRAKVHNIILLEGYYKSGINFKSDTHLSDVNLIGEGKVIIDNMKQAPLVITGNVYVRNIQFVNGSRGSLRSYLENPYKVCTYVCCKFNSSLVDSEDVSKAQSLGGLRIQGGTHYLYRCEASYNGFDGFSYHAAPDGSSNAPHVAEVECKAFHNGEHNAYESNNASTAHDGTHIIRLNCVYGYSHGGNVADVHKNTVSFNIGCSAYSVMNLGEKYREYQANFFSATNAVMYLLACKSYGSYYDLSSWNSGNILSDKVYKREYKNNGSIILLKR